MNDYARKVRRRMEAKGKNGEYLSLLTGTETLDELKKLILHLTQECPRDRNHPYCPFRILSGLSYASMSRTITNLSQDACLNLLEMELNCRTQSEQSATSPQRDASRSCRGTS